MMKGLSAILSSMGVACGTLSSMLAVAALQEAPTTKTSPRDASPDKAETPPVRIYKSAPRPKAAAPMVQKKVAAEPNVAKAAVKMAPVIRFDPDGQINQMMTQFRPILRAEYHVIRAACNPTPEQRKAIAHSAERLLRDATRKFIESQRRAISPALRAANDPRRLIEEGLVQAIKAHLSAEQAARYPEELAKKAARRKQLTLRNLVARLDNVLVLTPDQRDKLGESLAAHWDDTWGQSPEMLLYDNNYFPPIADRYVSPLLDVSQKKIWESTRRFQGFTGGFGMMGGAIMEDDPIEDEELREARLAAAKKDAHAPQPGPPVREFMKVRKKVMEKAPGK